MKWDLKQSLESLTCTRRAHLHCDFIVEGFIHKNQSYTPTPSHTYCWSMYYVCMCGIKNVAFYVNIGNKCKWCCGEGGPACACEHMSNYTNSPENILTLILHPLIRSLSNIRFCQIRPIFPILLFWSKFKTACKYVKLAIRYQIINEEVFFSTPFSSNA